MSPAGEDTSEAKGDGLASARNPVSASAESLTVYSEGKDLMGFRVRPAPPVGMVDNSEGVALVADDAGSLDLCDDNVGDDAWHIQHCRPDVPNIIRDAVTAHQDTEFPTARIGVLVCGPAGMADAARETVKQVLKGGFQHIEYFEEAYGW